MKRVFLILLIVISIISPTIARAENSTYDLKVYKNAEDERSDSPLEVSYDGLVPCGRCLKAKDKDDKTTVYNHKLDSLHSCKNDKTYIPCTLCHTFIIFDHIISFTLGTLIPSLALLVIVFAGILLITAASNPEKVNKGKSTLTYAVLGLFLAYFSWAIITVIVSSFMDWDIDWGSQGIQVQHMCETTLESSVF